MAIVIRIIAPALLALIWNGRIAAQPPNVRPHMQIAGESNGTLQSREETQKPVIGTDGHRQSLQLVRSHPLLVQAAGEAVLQYVYKPTFLNGNPVPGMTSMVTPFELPPQ